MNRAQIWRHIYNRRGGGAHEAVQVRAVLTALVSATKGERFLWTSDLEDIVCSDSSVLKARSINAGQIRRYLNGTTALHAQTAWDLGNALRCAGVAWMSGVLMLYAAGYLREFVGVLGRTHVRTSYMPGEDWAVYVPMLRLLLSVDALLLAAYLCKDSELSRLYATCDELTRADVESIETAFPNDTSVVGGSECEWFLAAHRAKQHWTFTDEIHARLSYAWKGWVAYKTPAYPGSPLREHLEAAIAFDSGRALNYEHRESYAIGLAIDALWSRISASSRSELMSMFADLYGDPKPRENCRDGVVNREKEGEQRHFLHELYVPPPSSDNW